MNRLVLAVAASLLLTGNAFAADTCAKQATDKKLAGAALASFNKKCADDAKSACEKTSAEKKLAGAAKTSFEKKCIEDATGASTPAAK